MANPKGHIKSLGTVPLAEGEQSRPVRVRAEAWVFEQLKGMGAAEVGQLIASALRERNSSALREKETRNALEGEVAISSRGGANSTRLPRPKRRVAPEHLRPGYVPTAPLPALEPMKPVKGKAAELLELLKISGSEMVKDGNRYAVEQAGIKVATFSGASGGALLTRPGLLTSAGPDKWTLVLGLPI